MIPLWFLGAAIFFWSTLLWRAKTKYPLHKLPYILVAAFSVMSLWLYFPASSFRFRHTENEASLREFLSNNQFNSDVLVHKANSLFRAGEYSWSFICYESALNTKQIKLNEFYPFYIADLFKIGREDDATNASLAMINNIQSDVGSRWPTSSDSNIIKYSIGNTYEAKSVVELAQQKLFDDLAAQLQRLYLNSLTNITPKYAP